MKFETIEATALHLKDHFNLDIPWSVSTAASELGAMDILKTRREVALMLWVVWEQEIMNSFDPPSMELWLHHSN